METQSLAWITDGAKPQRVRHASVKPPKRVRSKKERTTTSALKRPAVRVPLSTGRKQCATEHIQRTRDDTQRAGSLSRRTSMHHGALRMPSSTRTSKKRVPSVSLTPLTQPLQRSQTMFGGMRERESIATPSPAPERIRKNVRGSAIKIDMSAKRTPRNGGRPSLCPTAHITPPGQQLSPHIMLSDRRESITPGQIGTPVGGQRASLTTQAFTPLRAHRTIRRPSTLKKATLKERIKALEAHEQQIRQQLAELVGSEQ